jgi:hypothetical protein
MWQAVPKALAPFRTAGKVAHALGFAGSPTRHTSEVFARSVIVNMFARAAVQGVPPEHAVAQAEAEMRQIYGA